MFYQNNHFKTLFVTEKKAVEDKFSVILLALSCSFFVLVLTRVRLLLPYGWFFKILVLLHQNNVCKINWLINRQKLAIPILQKCDQSTDFQLLTD